MCQLLWADLLPGDYNKDTAPRVGGRPVEVNVSIAVLSLEPEVSSKQAFLMDFFFQLHWYDYRLRAPPREKVTLGHQWRDKLWLPDMYFRNSIGGGLANMLHPSVYFVITNGSRVYMASRFQMRFGCKMHFRKFPFDTQLCYINVTTLSQTVDIMRLSWDKFKFGSHVVLPEFELIDGAIGDHTPEP
ncbi:gamma-aminobutyric acid receptor subunit beta-like [Oppia nitens]|uniref:gamma-aminobutyric acid receptor subunit beta-like n=1 Tax=Oppia nitens TaxID=1686743 RepID=UPI0023DACA3C|nr:gamma-aminobutyric acid receptor subunit beta-like [Oppia nitens]